MYGWNIGQTNVFFIYKYEKMFQKSGSALKKLFGNQ